MREKIVLASIITLLWYLFSGPLALATLVPVNDYIVYDDVSNQYWQKDLGAIAEKVTGSTSGAMHGYDVASEINELNASFSGQNWGDWRLASMGDIGNLLVNSLADITSAFVANYEWTDPQFEHNLALFGMVDSGFPDNKDALFISWFHHDDGSSVFDTYGSFWSDEHNTSFGASGWFVADALPVPEPATGLLFFIGMILLYRKNKDGNYFAA